MMELVNSGMSEMMGISGISGRIFGTSGSVGSAFITLDSPAFALSKMDDTNCGGVKNEWLLLLFSPTSASSIFWRSFSQAAAAAAVAAALASGEEVGCMI